MRDPGGSGWSGRDLTWVMVARGLCESSRLVRLVREKSDLGHGGQRVVREVQVGQAGQGEILPGSWWPEDCARVPG